MRGRRIRKLEIERLMGRQAWSAIELSQVLRVSPLNMRRYLRRYLRSGRLTRKKFGVTWFYVIVRFLKPSNFSYGCPRCGARMDVYKIKCGCEFQLCGKNRLHDIFKYCVLHKGSIPRFEKIEAECAQCTIKQIIKLDRKDNKLSDGWLYHGRLCLPGQFEKKEIYECPKCQEQSKFVEDKVSEPIVQ